MSKKRIVFMGTPDFAVESLKKLIENNYNVVGVVTVPDKPAGRGQKMASSAVKKYAVEQGLPVLQPAKMKDTEFLEQLQELKPDIQVVVAFRMLPEVVWAMPEFGTFNLHASLLPQYRGAAPINWAIINGEKKSGVTTFFLDKQIDTGSIIKQYEVAIEDTDSAGTYHDKLMSTGAGLVCETIDLIEEGDINPIPQNDVINEDTVLNDAPKIFKDDCRIEWDNDVDKVYNFVRGLSPYPAAWTEFYSSLAGKSIGFKIFDTAIIKEAHTCPIGTILSDGKSELKIAAKHGFLKVESLQPAGKRRMNTSDFLRGFKDIESYRCR